MSDRKNRKSGAERRQERVTRENQEKKKVRLTAIIVTAALAVLFCGAMLINSNYIRRHSTAVSAGSLKFTPAEFDYFFNSAYSEYQNLVYQNMPDYASEFLPDQNMPLKSQIRDTETGETWADFFENSAISKMAEIAAFYDAAKQAGFTLSDEKRADMEAELLSLKQTAEQYGYESVNKFLQTMYGASMNEKTVERLSEIVYTAETYKEHIRESFSYTDDELAAYYNEAKDKLDTFTYRYIHVKTADVGAETDYASTEEYEQAKADAIAESVRQGEEIAAGIKSEQDLIDAARAYDAELYELDSSTLRHYKGELLGDTQGPWLREPERKEGDVTAIEFSNGCYVQYYIGRSVNDYNLTNLRQLMISPETVSPDDYPEGESDAAYGEAVAAAKVAAREEAELVLGALKADGVTEEKFIELIGQYSDDTTTEGGLFENVYRYETEGRLDEAVNEWLFAPGRAVGDYELIETEDGTQYILYMSSFGERYDMFLADKGLREHDYTAWDEATVRPEAKKHWAFALTQ